MEGQVPMARRVPEGPPRVQDHDDGKFQTLALMDAHDPDHVVALAHRGGRTQVPRALPQAIDEAQKPGKAGPGEGVKLAGPLIKSPQVGLALAAAGHRARVVEI